MIYWVISQVVTAAGNVVRRHIAGKNQVSEKAPDFCCLTLTFMGRSNQRGDHEKPDAMSVPRPLTCTCLGVLL
jgi:hypothetical protein